MAIQSLDNVIENLSSYNGGLNNLSGELEKLSGTLEGDTANVAFDEVSNLIKEQGKMSVKELKSSRSDLKSLKQKILDSDRISEKDRGNILSLLNNQENVVDQNATIMGRAKELIGKTISENSVDIASVASGVIADSPALMLATKFIGDKFNESREKKKQQRQEQIEREERITAAQQQQEQENSVLREQITNEQTLQKLNIERQEVVDKAKALGINEQDYIDRLKDQLIEQSKTEKLRRDNAEAEKKRIEELQEKFGIDVAQPEAEVTPVDSPVESSAPEKVEAKVEGVEDGGALHDLTKEGLFENPPYLEQIRDLLKFMIDEQANSDLAKIEADREAKRLAQRQLKEIERQGDLLKENNTITANQETGGGQGFMSDMFGDVIGGIAGALGIGGILGGAKKGIGGALKKTGGLFKSGGSLLKRGGLLAGTAAVATGGFLANKTKKILGNAPSAKVTAPNAPDAKLKPMDAPDLKPKVDAPVSSAKAPVMPDAPKVSASPKITSVPGESVAKKVATAAETTLDAAKGASKAGKTAAKVAPKVLAKSFLKNSAKFGLKMIPIAGAVAGGIFALGRLFKGDYTGAAMEAGGIFLPSVAGLPVDAALVAKDMYKDIHGTDYEKDLISNPTDANAKMAQLKDYAMEQMGIGQDAAKDGGEDPSVDGATGEVMNLSKSEQDLVSSAAGETGMGATGATGASGADGVNSVNGIQPVGGVTPSSNITPDTGTVENKTAAVGQMAEREMGPVNNDSSTNNFAVKTSTNNTVNNNQQKTVIASPLRNQESSYREAQAALSGSF